MGRRLCLTGGDLVPPLPLSRGFTCKLSPLPPLCTQTHLSVVLGNELVLVLGETAA